MAEKNKTDKYIVFCGVHFMAETADILTEDWQKVLLPALTAGCPMANMADLDQAEKAWELLKAEFGDEETVPVTYINSKAEIKAFCGRHGGTTVTSGMPARFFLGHYLRKREFFSYLTRTLVKTQPLI